MGTDKCPLSDLSDIDMSWPLTCTIDGKFLWLEVTDIWNIHGDFFFLEIWTAETVELKVSFDFA